MNTAHLDQSAINCLLSPVLNPSGRWADFNPVWLYWHGLQTLVSDGLILRDQLPDEPDPSDYPNLSAPRSERWENLPDNGFPMLTTIRRTGL